MKKSLCARRRRGQSLLEYILLMASLSMASIAFAKFLGTTLLGEGLNKLPAKVSACLSHSTNTAGGPACQ